MRSPPLASSRDGLPVLLAGLLALSTPADSSSQDVLQFVHRRWAHTDALPQSTAAAIAQTRDGYLWIGTQSGLVRFDGVRFTVFDSTNTPALSSRDITALLAGRDGKLWIGTAGGGLVRLADGRFNAFGAAHGLPHQVVTALAEDRAGALWVGTGGGAGRFDPDAGTFAAVGGEQSGHVTALAADATGTIWIGSHRGVSRWQDGKVTTVTTAEGLPSNDVRALLAARDGSVWIGSEGGLARLQDGRFVTYTTKDGLASSFVRSFAEDRDGVLWMGTLEGGLHRMVSGRIEPVRLAVESPPDDIRALLPDNEGNLWIGTSTDGLHRITPAVVHTHGVPEGLSHDVALPIVEDTQGTLWVGTYGGGLNRRHDGGWRALTVRDGLPSPIVLSLARARDGGLWVGTRAGLARVLPGERISIPDAALGLPRQPVLAVLEDRQGAVWLGTRTGIIRLAGSSVRRFGAGDGLGGEVILALFERRDGTVLAGSEGGGLSRFDGTRFTPVVDPDRTGQIVYSVSEDARGTLWLATNKGVVRLGARGATVSVVGGVRSSVYRVLEDGLGFVWLSTDQGLLRARIADFEGFEAGRLAQVPTAHFTDADGMRSAEVNGGIQPAGWQASDGRLWFPTLKGAVVIDPRRLPSDRPPPSLVVEEVRFDRELVAPQPSMSGGPGVRSLEFQYTAAVFRAPDTVQFRHRLEGYDDDWVEAGVRRTAYYTNLPPGDYRFRVSARVADGPWSNVESAVAFRLLPHFYQTRGFYTLVALAGTLLVLGAHRARVSRLKTRQRELATLAEERRLAYEALRESETRFRTLFGNMLEGVYRRSASGQLLLANRAYIEMLGYERFEDLAAVRPDDLYADAASAHAVRDALAQSGEARNLDVLLRGRDGQQVAALESARVLRDDGGGIAAVEGLVVDVSARRNLEEQVRQLQKMQLVGRLAGAVAHDFNNLLTPIIGYTEMLGDELPPASALHADLEEIRRAAESASSLTRQLLVFSRQEVIHRRVIDLNEVTGQFERILRRLIGEHIALSVRLAPQPLPVKADWRQVEQVLLNLAVNARDAMPDGGTLVIDTRAVGPPEAAAADAAAQPRVLLSVRDSGVGIPPAITSQLFTPFFTTKEHGTGLGLATVHDIVTASGGAIDVESEPGHGATFRVYFPRASEPILSDTPVSVEKHRGSGTVLVVEDSDQLRQLTRRTLEKAGYVVLVARDAAEAERIEHAHDGTIDLLLTDVILPGRSGPQLADALAQRRPGMRVVYMTGYFREDVQAHGLREDGVRLLQKPFKGAALLDAVHEALKSAITGERRSGDAARAAPC